MPDRRYELMALRRAPIPAWLRVVDLFSSRLAAYLYFTHYPPRQTAWGINEPWREAMASVQQVAEKFPGAYVLIEIDEADPPPRIVMRLVTDPSFEGFTAEITAAE